MRAQTKIKSGGVYASLLMWLACMVAVFPGTVLGSNSPVSDDGLKLTSDDLRGPVHVVRGRASDLRQAAGEWIEESPDQEWIWTYDRAKQIVEREWLRPIVKPPLLPKTYTCLARDPSDKIVQLFACNAQRSSIDDFRQVFLYNSAGHLAEQHMIHLEENPSLVSREVYEYEGGQKVAEREYDAHGELKRLITIDHDLGRNAVTVYARSAEGDVWSKSRHLLDSMGRRIESMSLGPNDQILSRYRMAYDSHGNLTEQTSSGRGADVREVIMYEYDRWGNWTKKTTHTIEAGNESRRILRRTIEYFPD